MSCILDKAEYFHTLYTFAGGCFFPQRTSVSGVSEHHSEVYDYACFQFLQHTAFSVDATNLTVQSLPPAPSSTPNQDILSDPPPVPMEEAERTQREEAERKQREEAERTQREEAERTQREEAVSERPRSSKKRSHPIQKPQGILFDYTK